MSAEIIIKKDNRKLVVHNKEKEETNKRDVRVDGYVNDEKIYSAEYKNVSYYSSLSVVDISGNAHFLEEGITTVADFLEQQFEWNNRYARFSKLSVWEKGEKKPIVFRTYKKENAQEIYIGQICLRLMKADLEIDIIDIVNAGLFACLFRKASDSTASLWESGEWQLLYKKKMVCPTFPTIDGIKYKLNQQCLQTICTSAFLNRIEDGKDLIKLSKEQRIWITKTMVLRKDDSTIALKSVNLDGTVELLM